MTEASPRDDFAQDRVQQAVESFVKLHTSGKRPTPAEFAAECTPELQTQILMQCNEFLAFDNMLGHQEWQEPADDEPDGRAFGEFVIQEELGRGGMGVVYLAYQRSLDRRVALKVMMSGLSLSKRHVERFRREAMATAQLRHPAIVPVYDFVEFDGSYALAMEYVAGRNLGDVLNDLSLRNQEHSGRVDGSLGIAPEKGYVAECAMLIAQVASALAVAHEAKIVHRDLKPRNLMIDEQRQVRLLDFGLAKSLDVGRASLSMSGEVNGTVHYMSPEQALGKRVEVDHRADIWSLGVMLYELLTLERPFDGKDIHQTISQITFKEPVPLQRRNARVPRDLVTVCSKAIEKDPHKRYQSATEFEADLLRFLNWEPVHAKPSGPLSRAAKFVRRHRAQALIAAALLLALTIVISVMNYRDALDGERADQLLSNAAGHAERGDYEPAIALTGQALALRSDELTRERFKRYNAESSRIENAAAWKVAESKRLLSTNPEQALQFAVEGEEQFSTVKTRSAVLDALGSSAELRSLRIAGASALCVASAPSGAHVAIAGKNGTLQVMTTSGPAEPRTLQGHDPSTWIPSVAFVDDERLVSISYDRTFRLWDRRSEQPLRSVSLGEFGPHMMMLDAARSRAMLVMQQAVAPYRSGARVYDTRTGDPVGPYVEHAKHVTVATLSADGEVGACFGSDRRLRAWRVADGAVVFDLPQPFQATSMAFAPDGSALAVGASDGGIVVFNARSGAVIGSARHSDRVSVLAFAPNDNRLLSGSWDHTARVWTFDPSAAAQPMQELCSLSCGDQAVRAVAFASSGELAAVASGKPNGVLRVFECASRGGKHALAEQAVGEAFLDVAFLAGDNQLLALTAKRAVVWNHRAQVGTISTHQPGRVDAIAFAGDGSTLLSGGGDERLRSWRRQDGRKLWETDKLGNPIERIAVRGSRAAVGLWGGDVRLHSSADGRATGRIDSGAARIAAVAFCGEDRLLTAGAARESEAGILSVHDLVTAQSLHTRQLSSPILAASVSEDGACVATVAEGEDLVQLWSLPSLAPLAAVKTAGLTLRSVALNPSGDRLLVGGSSVTAPAETAARVYDRGGELLRELPIDASVSFATFSPDGRFILTCTARQAQLWRAADGEQHLHVDLHRGRMLLNGAFGPDSAWAATSDKDGSVWIWPTDPVQLAESLR